MSGPFKLRSGNTTPFKRIGSSPVKQTHQPEQSTYTDSLDIYKRQTELNTIADQWNKHIRDKTNVVKTFNHGYDRWQDRFKSMMGIGGKQQLQSVEGPQRTYARVEKSKEEDAKNSEEGRRLGSLWRNKQYQFYSSYTTLKDKNPANIDMSYGAHEFIGSDVDIGKGQTWGANKYKPVFPTKPKVKSKPKIKSKPKVELIKMPVIQPKLIITSSLELKPIPSYRTDIKRTYKDYGGGTKKGHKKPIVVKYKDGSSKRVSQEHYDKNIAPYYNNK